MTQYFPADVSLRVSGDISAAQKLYGTAANLLFKALAVQRNGDKQNVTLRAPLTDGSLVEVRLHGNLKHVYVQPASAPESPEEHEETQPPEETKVYINDMWSGIARGNADDIVPQVVPVPNEESDDPATVPGLRTFHPDVVTSGAYQLNFAWQNPHRLGVSQDGGDSGVATSAYPKPSMYSGSMKRVVSAVLGLGRTVTETAEFISEELPVSYPDLIVANQFDYTALRTHGIYKGDDGGIWLIEISKLNGVLAMPLPIFDGTDEGGYEEWLDSIGDTDTLAIVLEFGGLPTGETFPTGVDLADAIADGKILELCPPENIVEFYHDSVSDLDKYNLYADCGWAFSESGKLASNVCFWYSRPDVALAPQGDWLTDGYDSSAPSLRYMQSEQYRIRIQVSLPVEDAPAEGFAICELVDSGLLVNKSDRRTEAVALTDVYNHAMTRVPFNEGEELAQFNYFGRQSLGSPLLDDGLTGAPMHVFYDGERLEVVRLYPWIDSIYAQGWYVGDTIDLGVASDVTLGTSLPDHSFTNKLLTRIGLIVPPYTREAYVLVKYVWDQTSFNNIVDANNDTTIAFATDGIGGDVTCTGYFADYGVIDFSVFHMNPIRPPNVLSSFITPWFAQITNYDFPVQIKWGTTINTGPLAAFVSSDVMEIPQVGMGPQYRQSDNVAPFGIPDDTPARSITFVGSCSDG